MSLIKCKLGPTETNVGGRIYAFALDREGRAVARVDNPDHAKCFLAVDCYEEVEEAAPRTPPHVEPDPDPIAPPPAPGLGDPNPVAPAPAPAAAGTDIIVIKGIGETLKTKLAAYGVDTVEDLLKLNADQLAFIDKELDLHGRIERDDWLGQAREIAAQDPSNAVG